MTGSIIGDWKKSFVPLANRNISPVQTFEQWARKSVAQTFPLSTLKDAVVGIDASFYLDLRLNGLPKDEPLRHALGGVPFTLKQLVIDDIAALKDAGAKPLFVFGGLDHVNKPRPEYLEPESMRAADEAWRKYNVNDAEGVANDFAKVKYPQQLLVRWLRDLLTKLKIEYLVAPYSSVAQLSYMERLSEQYIDCIWGSTDYFLFNIDKVVVDIPLMQDAVRSNTFTWVSKSACEERLKISPDFLRDVQLLLGTSFAPAFPSLARQATAPKSVGVTDAMNLLIAHGRSVLQLCQANREDPGVPIEWELVYKKAVMSIRHHIAILQNGSIEPMNAEHAPGDVHDFVGQNLPPEMFFYLSRGAIGPEPLNWLTNTHINLTLPPGVIDSQQHRSLVFEKLNPIRAQTLMVMSEFMPNYYRNRKVQINDWTGRERPELEIGMREQAPLKDKLSGWKVKDAQMSEFGTSFSLLDCLQALKDDKFREQTVNAAKTAHVYPALSSTKEVVTNTFYRFLHVRGYVNDKHQLTTWGQALETVLSKLKSTKRANDIAILSVELMRFGLLNGSEGDGSEPKSQDKAPNVQSSINLVSKIACLDRLPHQPIGWIGPLDQRLLSFSWTVSAVRSSLRILMESIMVAMFLAAEVQRDRDDWTTIASRLPLINDQGCSLGLVAETYFDQVVSAKDQVAEVKEKFKTSQPGHVWFKNAKGEVGKSLDNVHNIWTAVYSGSQVAGKENKDARVFNEAQTVLKPLW